MMLVNNLPGGLLCTSPIDEICRRASTELGAQHRGSVAHVHARLLYQLVLPCEQPSDDGG